MTQKNWRRVLSIIICTFFIFTSYESFSVFVASAEEEVIDYSKYGLGDLDDEDFNYSEITIAPDYLDSAQPLRTDLPNSVDLSKTPYFPPIGNQQQMNSCVAWATTYYQFTYEANRLNNIPTTENNTYSPAWTFNLWNGGVNNGSTNVVAYEILHNHGAVKYNENPYKAINNEKNINESNFDFSWCTDTNAIVRALDTQLVDYVEVRTPSYQTPITNNQSECLNSIKSILCGTDNTYGKILNIRVSASSGLGNWSYGNRKDSETGNNIYINDSVNGHPQIEQVVYRAQQGKGGHAMTIVGYDDDVWCDINNNGDVDDGELGAFKVANSWGNRWKNDGYVWVAYDALNKVSGVSGTWESSETGTRIGNVII